MLAIAAIAAPPPGIFLIIPVLWVVLWPLLCTIASYSSGWQKLAKRFRTDAPFTGAAWKFQSGRIGIANYGLCLIVGANAQGMYLRPMLLMRFAHLSLFIPWYEITVERRRFLFRDYVVLGLGRGIDVRFMIHPNLAERLRSQAGKQWPAEQVG